MKILTAAKEVGINTNATKVNTFTTWASWDVLLDMLTIAAVPRDVKIPTSLLISELRNETVSRSFSFGSADIFIFTR